MSPMILSYLTGKSWYSSELQSLGMALQANLIVLSRWYDPNGNDDTEKKQKKDTSTKHVWFYRFVQSVLIGYSGGIFGTIFLGKPCPFLLNDIHMACCLLAFLLIQILLPFLLRQSNHHIILQYGIVVPIQMVSTAYAQLFRTMGLLKFITVCHLELTTQPMYHTIATKYYDIPIVGPILYGTLLGNMGGFIAQGVEHYTSGNGMMPYPFQNGNLY